jgi:hypothetical protein
VNGSHFCRAMTTALTPAIPAASAMPLRVAASTLATLSVGTAAIAADMKVRARRTAQSRMVMGFSP